MIYETHLFLEIIESEQGVQFLRADQEDEIKVRFYQGKNGKLVMIDVSDEDISDTLGKGYLHQLGLSDLIPALFPEEKEIAQQQAS